VPLTTDPLLRYIPERYIASNEYHGKGISAQDIIKYIGLCGKKAMWEENGRDQVRLEFLGRRNMI
jgi:hypothetical protein